MHESDQQVLLSQYGMEASSFEEIAPGWSAAALRVRTARGDYFLKVYDKLKPSTKGWVARIDSYMPVVLWLNANTGLRGRMTAPLLTKGGSYKWEDASRLYMLFPFIDGRTIGGDRLSPEQARELGRIVAELHDHGAEIPVSTENLRETFDVSFCAVLMGWLENMPHNARLSEALMPHAEAIARAAAELQAVAASLRQSEPRFVLCHADIHGWNLMQSERLMLIDWEGLKLAPVEADLFSFTETYFFDYAWEEFISVYRSIRTDYRVNEDAMRFYRLRRRLEDIHAFAESILFDSLSSEDMERSFYYLERECGMMSVMK